MGPLISLLSDLYTVESFGGPSISARGSVAQVRDNWTPQNLDVSVLAVLHGADVFVGQNLSIICKWTIGTRACSDARPTGRALLYLSFDI